MRTTKSKKTAVVTPVSEPVTNEHSSSYLKIKAYLEKHNAELDPNTRRYFDAFHLGESTVSHYFNGHLSYLLIGEIEKISAGGLCGYKAKYEDKRTVNEEYIFDIPNSRAFNLLDIYIMIKKSSITYDESYKNRIVAEILNGIESN